MLHVLLYQHSHTHRPKAPSPKAIPELVILITTEVTHHENLLHLIPTEVHSMEDVLQGKPLTKDRKQQ